MLIDLRLLKAVNIAAATDNTRKYLEGVHVSVSGATVVMVATNGHKMIAARDQDRVCPEDEWPADGAIVPREQINKIKLSTRGHAIDGITFSDGDIEITTPDGVKTTHKAISGQFPDWRRIVPKTFSDKTAQFNASYLADFQKAAAIAMNRSENKTYTAVRHNGDAPALVHMGDDDVIFGIIMPVRAAAPKGIPAWVHATPESVKEVVE